MLLGDDPAAIAEALLEALRDGRNRGGAGRRGRLRGGAAHRRFHTSNEFGDWDTALHTFTFANAVHQGLRRAPSAELLRGVFDAAMSVYLDRFLNVPPARLPEPPTVGGGAGRAAGRTPALLDRQQQVDEAGDAGRPLPLRRRRPRRGSSPSLGGLLLREDRDFHTIQTVEAAFASTPGCAAPRPACTC